MGLFTNVYMYKLIFLPLLIFIQWVHGQSEPSFSYDAQTNVSVLYWVGNSQRFTIREKGKIVSAQIVNEQLFYYVFVPVDFKPNSPTDFGDIFLKVRNQANQVLWQQAIPITCYVESGSVITNFHLFSWIADENCQFTQEIRIHNLTNGKKLYQFSIKRFGGVVQHIVSRKDRCYVELSNNNDEKTILEILYASQQIRMLQAKVNRFHKLVEDSTHQYLFLINEKDQIVQYLSAKPTGKISFKNRAGKVIIR